MTEGQHLNRLTAVQWRLRNCSFGSFALQVEENLKDLLAV